MVKILFLAASPSDDTSRLQLDEEMRAIREKLRESRERDQFVVEQEWAVRVEDLSGHLLRHKPHIVHFSGHGSQAGQLILKDNAGESKPVASEALTRLFAILKDNIRCVVLNACYSDVQAEGIVESIDCVVGMTRAIPDESAIVFAASFYQALGYGRNIQEAFDLGCTQIKMEQSPKFARRRDLALVDTACQEEDIPKLKVASGVDAGKIYLAPRRGIWAAVQHLPALTRRTVTAAALAALALVSIIGLVILKSYNPCSSHLEPFTPDAMMPRFNTRIPPRKIISRVPTVSPTQVRFSYRNSSGKDLRLLILNVSKYYEELDHERTGRDAWMDWPFCRSDNYKVYDGFGKGSGWFCFWVYAGGPEAPFLGCHNLFHTQSPWLDVTKDNTGRYSEHFKGTEEFKQ